MAKQIAVAVKYCSDQYGYPEATPTETRYRITIVIQGISEAPDSEVRVWDPSTNYNEEDLVKASNGLLYKSLANNRGNNPIDEWQEENNRVPGFWEIVRPPEMNPNFELFLMKRTESDDEELIVNSAYLGIAYPPSFQLVDPTRYSLVNKLWRELPRRNRPDRIANENQWDPYKRQLAPEKNVVFTNNPDMLYNSRALIMESRDISGTELFKDAVLATITQFVRWYNWGIKEGWTTMNSDAFPNGWKISNIDK